MKKEIIICIIIVIAIIIGDILLQKYKENSLNLIGEKLENLKQSINSETESIDGVKVEEIEEINNEWDKRFNVLTCFVAHNELEKIKTQLVVIKAGIEVNDSEYVYEEIDKTVYLLDHIRDKQSVRLDNIL